MRLKNTTIIKFFLILRCLDWKIQKYYSFFHSKSLFQQDPLMCRSNYSQHHQKIVLFASKQHSLVNIFQKLFLKTHFSIRVEFIILSSGLSLIATSINSLSKNGTLPSIPQAARDLLALKQSY